MYGSIPKETLAEVLLYLAEKETFGSLKQFGTISQKQISRALVDLAKQLKKEAKDALSQEEVERMTQELKKPFQEILAKLSPTEKERLLKGFLN